MKKYKVRMNDLDYPPLIISAEGWKLDDNNNIIFMKDETDYSYVIIRVINGRAWTSVGPV
jgi:hypothetical protein